MAHRTKAAGPGTGRAHAAFPDRTWGIGGDKANRSQIEMFRTLLDNSSDAIEVIDQPTLRYLDVNETACRTLGYTRDELLSMRVPDIDQRLSPSQWEELEADLRAKSSVTIESMHRRKDGSEFPVEVNVSLVRIDDRDLRIAVVRDISQRKADEANLKIFRALLDQASDVIEMVDMETLHYLDVNEAASRVYGYSREELLSMRVHDIDPHVSKDQLKTVNEQLHRTRSATLESTHRRKDGSEFPVEVSISLANIAGQEYRLAVVRDITERKKAEESQQLFRSLIDNSNDAVEVIEPGTLRFLDVNETGCRTLGYSREEMLSMSVPDIDTASKELNEDVDRQIRQSGVARFESTHRRKDGSIFPVEISVTLVELDKPYLLSIARDITERKEAEREVEDERLFSEALIQSLPDIFFLIDTQGTLLRWNREFAQLVGRPPEAISTAPPLAFVYEEDRPIVRQKIRELLDNGSASVEARLVLRTGIRDYYLVGTGIETRLGMNIIGIGIDITERKRAEALIRDRERQLEESQRIGRLGHWEWDADGERGSCSDELFRIFGYEPGTIDLTMEGFLRAVYMNDRDIVTAMMQKAVEAHEPTEADFRIVIPGGEMRWVHEKSSTLLDDDGNPTRIFGTCQDITERKQADEALHRTNRALKLLSECNAMLVHAEAEQPFLEDICRLAVETGGYMMAWIGLAEDDPGKTVRPIAASGYEKGYLDEVKISWADTELGQGPTGTAIRTGKTDICTHSSTDPKLAPWRKAILKRGYQSSLALPLVSRHRTLGALTIYAAEPQAFSEEEVGLLRELASEVSYGIETLRTRSEHEQHAVILRQSLEQSIQAIADTVEARDPYTAGHQRNVADLAAAIATEMKMPEDQIQGIRLAAIIHDLGKIHIPAEILSKPGRLSDIEHQMMRTHPQAGYDIVKGIEFPWPIAQMVLQHHERLDGSGYPQGLSGDQILVEAKILAVADVVEAMSSHRPYRGGLGLEAALHEIEQQRGVLYDPTAVGACIRLFREQGFSLPVSTLLPDPS